MVLELGESPKWYAVYTRSRAEKKLYNLLTLKDVICFLPMTKVLKQYSDRKKWVQEPLLRSYVFVYIDQQKYFDVLNTAGAVRYVCFEGKAAHIPDNQITALYNFVHNTPQDLELELGQVAPGEPMEVVNGPLKGVQGELIQIRGNHRLLLRFDTLSVGIHTEIELQDVRPIKERVRVA